MPLLLLLLLLVFGGAVRADRAVACDEPAPTPGVYELARGVARLDDGDAVAGCARLLHELPSRTRAPSRAPTVNPTVAPTLQPTLEPTLQPTLAPTANPTTDPTLQPTLLPTLLPTLQPTLQPTLLPTFQPTTIQPTFQPTLFPTDNPTLQPTLLPTSNPTLQPTLLPTIQPTLLPTIQPTLLPTTSAPTRAPTLAPSSTPSISPTSIGTYVWRETSSTAFTTIAPSPQLATTISPTPSHELSRGSFTYGNAYTLTTGRTGVWSLCYSRRWTPASKDPFAYVMINGAAAASEWESPIVSPTTAPTTFAVGRTSGQYNAPTASITSHHACWIGRLVSTDTVRFMNSYADAVTPTYAFQHVQVAYVGEGSDVLSVGASGLTEVPTAAPTPTSNRIFVVNWKTDAVGARSSPTSAPTWAPAWTSTGSQFTFTRSGVWCVSADVADATPVGLAACLALNSRHKGSCSTISATGSSERMIARSGTTNTALTYGAISLVWCGVVTTSDYVSAFVDTTTAATAFNQRLGFTASYLGPSSPRYVSIRASTTAVVSANNEFAVVWDFATAHSDVVGFVSGNFPATGRISLPTGYWSITTTVCATTASNFRPHITFDSYAANDYNLAWSATGGRTPVTREMYNDAGCHNLHWMGPVRSSSYFYVGANSASQPTLDTARTSLTILWVDDFSSKAPTRAPTSAPTNAPTRAPTIAPTPAPTNVPTRTPTLSPTQIGFYSVQSPTAEFVGTRSRDAQLALCRASSLVTSRGLDVNKIIPFGCFCSGRSSGAVNTETNCVSATTPFTDIPTGTTFHALVSGTQFGSRATSLAGYGTGVENRITMSLSAAGVTSSDYVSGCGADASTAQARFACLDRTDTTATYFMEIGGAALTTFGWVGGAGVARIACNTVATQTYLCMYNEAFTLAPTRAPTLNPTLAPTNTPTLLPTRAPTRAPGIRIFNTPTPTLYAGNFGSRATVDGYCATQRTALGLSCSRTTALLSYDGDTIANLATSASPNFATSLAVYGSTTGMIASSWTDFVAGTWTQTMNAAGLPSMYFWTGGVSTGNRCGGQWTIGNSGSNGDYGHTSLFAAGLASLNNNPTVCASTAAFMCLCVET